jgi:hypothetical protein
VLDKNHQKLTNCSHPLGLEQIKECLLFSKEGFHERREREVRNGINPREMEQEGMTKGIFGNFSASGEAELAITCSSSGGWEERRGERGEVGFGAVKETKSGVSIEDRVQGREISKGGIALDRSDTGTGELLAQLLAALATQKRKDRLGSVKRGGGGGSRERRRVMVGIRSGGGVKEGFGGGEEAARHVRAD